MRVHLDVFGVQNVCKSNIDVLYKIAPFRLVLWQRLFKRKKRDVNRMAATVVKQHIVFSVSNGVKKVNRLEELEEDLNE